MRLPIFAPILSLCLVVNAGLPARAQEEVAPAPVAPQAIENEPARENPPLAAPDFPDKNTKAAARRAGIEMRLRAMMSDFGIDETAKQDAIIGYLAEDEAGKNTLRDAARRLMNAVKRNETPARTRDLVAVYKASLDADRERRGAAQGALDAKIGFSLSPRLEATLWLFGVLGEGQAGLPLGVLAPRTAIKNEVAAPNAAAPRTGVLTGNLTRKGEGWIEVRDDNGLIERYLPLDTVTPKNKTQKALNADTDGNYDYAVLDAMKTAQIGDRVRLEWAWNERKRVVRLTVLPATLGEQTALPEPAPQP